MNVSYATHHSRHSIKLASLHRVYCGLLMGSLTCVQLGWMNHEYSRGVVPQDSRS
jgi:hypothetical protein